MTVVDPPRPSTDPASSGDILVKVAPRVWKQIEELARKTGKSPGDLIGDAIGLEQWVEETRETGGRLFVQGDNGTLYEVNVK